MASTSEWLHFHQTTTTTNPPPPPPAGDLLWSGRPSDATAVSTTTTINSSSNNNNNPPTSGPVQMGPDGRVGKPGRRRTRASRRTPTTLLNTDAANFRAMVQQFTGGPTASFQAPAQWAPAGLGAGPGPRFAVHYPYGIGGGGDQSDMVRQGAGRGGGAGGDDVVFGNVINVGVFPGASTASENRGSSSVNNTSSTGGFQF